MVTTSHTHGYVPREGCNAISTVDTTAGTGFYAVPNSQFDFKIATAAKPERRGPDLAKKGLDVLVQYYVSRGPTPCHAARQGVLRGSSAFQQVCANLDRHAVFAPKHPQRVVQVHDVHGAGAPAQQQVVVGPPLQRTETTCISSVEDGQLLQPWTGAFRTPASHMLSQHEQ
jgi:hypothetical protein